jgi:hypothetical protein
MFAITQLLALSLAFPDVCKVPSPIGPIPLPLVNISISVLAIPNVFNKFITAMPVHNLMTITPISNGDEVGAAGGMVSQMFIGSSRHMLGSFKVFYSCMPATKMLSPTGQNGMLPNMVGITLTPSQIKVIILS